MAATTPLAATAAVLSVVMPNLDAIKTPAGQPQAAPAHLHRLYVVGIPDHFTDPQLRAVFEKVRPSGQTDAFRLRGPD